MNQKMTLPVLLLWKFTSAFVSALKSSAPHGTASRLATDFPDVGPPLTKAVPFIVHTLSAPVCELCHTMSGLPSPVKSAVATGVHTIDAEDLPVGTVPPR